MRASKREHMLEAGLAIIEREGITALTFDAVAAESGVTKGGLLYHFPSRDALIESIHRYVAEQWVTSMRAAAGGRDAGDLDERERVGAYLRSTTSPTRAELLLMLEAADDPGLGPIWQGVLDSWAPSSEPDDAAAVRRLVVRLAADGLWLHSAIGGRPLTGETRERVEQELTALLDQ